MKLSRSLTMLILSGCTFAAVVPKIPRDLPAGTSRLAFDEESGVLIAIDASGKELGKVTPDNSAPPAKRQDSGTCTPLSSEDVQKLPGWKKLEDQANTNWGDGSRNIVTNPEDYRDSPANVCVSKDKPKITYADDKDCQTSTQHTEGKNVGTNGTVTLTSLQGTSFETTSSVTSTASFAQGFKTSVSIKIPEVAEVSAESSTTMTFENTQGKSTSSTENHQTSQAITVQSNAGKTCKLEYKLTKCTIRGNGEVNFLASGWVWFNYDDKTGSKENPDDKHYKWALNIEATLQDEKDRASPMTFDTVISSDTNGEYHNVCE